MNPAVNPAEHPTRPLPRIGLSVDAVFTKGPDVLRKHALNEPYVACVLDAGGLPLLFPNVPPEAATEYASAYLDTVSGLLLTGGDDIHPSRYGEPVRPEVVDIDPVRDAFEIALVEEVRRRGLPTLMICRGLQVANVALGGSLVQDIPSQVGTKIPHRRGPDGVLPLHDAEVVAGTRLHQIAGASRVRVNSSHHQSAARVAPSLKVTARSDDGVVEGLEDPTHPFFLAVQWHPERLPEDPLTKALFGAFLAACRGRT